MASLPRRKVVRSTKRNARAKMLVEYMAANEMFAVGDYWHLADKNGGGVHETGQTVGGTRAPQNGVALEAHMARPKEEGPA